MSMFSLFKKKRNEKAPEAEEKKEDAVVEEQEQPEPESESEPESKPHDEREPEITETREELPSAAEDCAQVTAESHASKYAPEAKEAAQPESVTEPEPAVEPEPESKTKPEAKPEPTEVAPKEKGEKKGFWARLTQGLRRTSGSIGSGLISVFRGKKIDDDLFEELETQLLMADLGVATTTKIIDNLTKQADRKQLKDAEALYELLQEQLAEILKPVDKRLEIPESGSPFVILMTGVNGVGKTTTIGKLAKQFKAEGKSVMLAAGDTFRAAAVEQLQVWGERNDIPVIAQHTGADSASVLYDALQAAKARDVDVLIADTAGRLQNKANLMEELKKLVRVMKKLDPQAPHEVMLTLDAGTGQNAISQAKLFTEAVGVSGIVMTKLDGTAKGGVIFAVADQFAIPIRYIGVGESLEDLRPFVAKDFIAALFDRNVDESEETTAS
ncbi:MULTISPECIES: signal recognition particle-docking protein FtsY [Idiomarina]|uniref:signal recognition particle-docking protein FtsY n=1 Tax=Idiomarina TaxID=135575 RepID=UPI000C54358F|nr:MULTISPECIES: signal recognition particle-docking protein FtsY [Idiomarina]MBP59013.1 signal recognition particle-docking protein FtsY [Idiomarina sp.]MDA6067573.1 signal recognition particle-docking protein FtsY [Idiomarina abyssalis]|tara:strand:- start:21660 stop:22985 length:1326 start_codon:yes stop_codon:yes gene_type:complete